MKSVVIVVLIVAISALAAQTLRHAYLRWVQAQDSVLEKYNPSFKNKIKDADSLESLDKEYAKIKEKVKKADEKLKKSNRKVSRYREEPFKTERELKAAIKKWERRSEEIRKTRFFWACGLIIAIIGSALFIKEIWLGLSFVIVGLTQMIWWVSPSFRYNEASAEYHRMLENKFFLSLITLGFVIVLWFMFNKYLARKNRAKANS
jgi:Flp pilus assembly protein TadB